MYTIREKQLRTFFSAETFDGASWGVSLFSVRDGKATTTYDYTIAGQLVSATTGNKTESFLWDGLALIRRGGVNYLNEPHAGGGAALLAGGHQKSAKPKPVAWGDRDFEAVRGHGARIGIPGRSGNGQTADPLGHPDGWNTFAYCNGRVTSTVDLYGALSLAPITTQAGMIQRILLSEVLNPTQTTNYDLDDASIAMQAIVNCIYNRINNYGKDVTHSGVKEYFGKNGI